MSWLSTLSISRRSIVASPGTEPDGAGRSYSRRPRCAPLSRALAVGATLAAPMGLLGCEQPDTYTFAPPCPRASVVADAADLSRFQPGGKGRDLTDLVFSSRITGLEGKCNREDGGRERVVVTVKLALTRGPAATGRAATVPFFVAVVDNKQILDEADMQVPVEFPVNVDHVAVTSPEITLSLPTTKEKSGAAFDVMAAFRLTPEELAFNRQQLR